MSKLWLPTGAHRDLNIEHRPGRSAGSFSGGGWKLCWHITVSPWVAVDSMVNVLKAKGAEPHLVIGGRPGFKFPVVVQLLPFNEAGRSLANGPGGGETNRANAIQVEICARPGNARSFAGGEIGSELFDLAGLDLPHPVMARAAESEDVDFDLCMREGHALGRQFNSGVAAWTDDTYKALANLARMVWFRREFEIKQGRSFQNTNRFSASGWTSAEGMVGHMHCPENDHSDPTTDFQGRKLVRFTKAGWQNL